MDLMTESGGCVENEIDEACFVNLDFERMRFLINGCDGSGNKPA